MGCRSDYMEPNSREQESVNVLGHLIFVYTQLQDFETAEEYLKRKKKTGYGDVANLDKDTATLCTILKGFKPATENTIVYNGRDPDARKLADWWDKHKKADQQREEREATNKRNQELVEAILTKLTPEELALFRHLLKNR